MKLINSSVEIIEPTGYTLQDIYEQIELAGRTCYKSEPKYDYYFTNDSDDIKITIKIDPTFDGTCSIKHAEEEYLKGNGAYTRRSSTAEDFVNRMVASKHYAMLEHGTVYLKFTDSSTKTLIIDGIRCSEYLYDNYISNKYSIIHSVPCVGNTNWYVTTNYRVLIENNWLDDLQYLCEPTEYHEKRITVRFICDRGVSHELVRHRVFSFAQESTRYCNYSKDKFGNELTFIIPSQLNKEELIEEFGDIEKLEYHKDIDKFQSSEWSDAANFLQSIAWCESNYLTLLDNGWKPQQARAVLPNTLKTEVVMTGFESDWDHFFELRCAKAAHPDMQKLANELKGKFHEKEVDNKDK